MKHRRLIEEAGIFAGCSAGSAALYSCAFLPVPYVWLTSFVALVPLFILAYRYKPHISALGAALAGAGAMAGTCFWLSRYHRFAVIPALILGAFFFAAPFGILSALKQKRGALFFGALLWAAAESARAYGPIPFPYALLPYCLADSKTALYIASAGGIELVGITLSCINAGIFYALRTHARGGLALRLVTLSAVLLFIAPGKPQPYNDVQLVHDASPRKEGFVRVSLVQPNAPDQNGAQAYTASGSTLMRLSETCAQRKPDIIVWPETAVVPPLFWHLRNRPDRAVYDYAAQLHAWLKDFHVALILGNAYVEPRDTARRNEYNSALLIHNGELKSRYDKTILVPFTEYAPSILAVKKFSDLLENEFGKFWTRGKGPVLFKVGEAVCAAPICFEDSFGRYLMSFGRPDFFIVLTDDAWARSEYMERQHCAMSQFRAAETGTPFVRAANSGITAALSQNGAVAARLPSSQSSTLSIDIALRSGKNTLFRLLAPYGPFVLHALCIALYCIVRGALAYIRKRKTI